MNNFFFVVVVFVEPKTNGQNKKEKLKKNNNKFRSCTLPARVHVHTRPITCKVNKNVNLWNGYYPQDKKYTATGLGLLWNIINLSQSSKEEIAKKQVEASLLKGYVDHLILSLVYSLVSEIAFKFFNLLLYHPNNKETKRKNMYINFQSI